MFYQEKSRRPTSGASSGGALSTQHQHFRRVPAKMLTLPLIRRKQQTTQTDRHPTAYPAGIYQGQT